MATRAWSWRPRSWPTIGWANTPSRHHTSIPTSGIGIPDSLRLATRDILSRRHSQRSGRCSMLSGRPGWFPILSTTLMPSATISQSQTSSKQRDQKMRRRGNSPLEYPCRRCMPPPAVRFTNTRLTEKRRNGFYVICFQSSNAHMNIFIATGIPNMKGWFMCAILGSRAWITPLSGSGRCKPSSLIKLDCHAMSDGI